MTFTPTHIFHNTGTDPILTLCDGQRCELLDKPSTVAVIFEVIFEDGFKALVFGEELEPLIPLPERILL